MINSKQRAHLRSLSNTIKPVVNVGKDGITPELTDSVAEVLKARELIKVNVLNNCPMDRKEVAITVSERTRSMVIQQLGNKITLYKRNHQEPVIEFPKDL